MNVIKNTKKCQFCGGEISEYAETCEHCGKVLEGKLCPYCKQKIPVSAKKCHFCGSHVERTKSKLVEFVNGVGGVILILLIIAGLTVDESGVSLIGALIFMIGWIIYFLPTNIADDKMHRQTVPILLVNLVFGVTFIGWIIALVWALSSDD